VLGWLLLSVIAAVALAFVEALTSRMQEPFAGPSDPVGWLTARFIAPWVIFVGLLWVVRVLVRRQPLNGADVPTAIVTHILGASYFPVIHMGALLFVHRALGRPAGLEWYRNVVSFYYVREVALYVLAVAVFHAIDLARRARARELAAAELRASLADARLRALRAQLSPHFLFNVLNAIGMLVRDSRDEQALAMLQQFAELLRGFLREPASDLVTLDDELRFTERYLEIQRTRFADRLVVSVDVPDDARGLSVPHLVLYPLVENAIQHGLAGCADAGHVSVRARSEPDQLVLEVEDDGSGMDAAVSSRGAGVGLENLRARLEQLYASAASLSVVPRTPRGVLARVAVPRRRASAA
jgi:signal transduction histidine kinase